MAVQIRPDGSLIVREDITFDFRGSHNGIFRTIPVRYERHGLPFALRLDGIGVYDGAGRPLRTEVSYPGRYARIKAWVPGAADARRTVSVVYRVHRALLQFGDQDELYWNVTGNEWDVPIQRAEALVDVPAGVGAEGVDAVAYTGPPAAAGRDWTLERAPGTLAFRTTRPLGPREGLTIVVGWPPGHVTGPPALRRAAWVVADNWPLGLPALTLALALAAWTAFGRDPRARRSVRPEYEPPPGLTPAEAGTLVDERADPRDATATLLDLAVRGYLHIERAGEGDGEADFVFIRRKPAGADVKPFERFILSRLFGDDLRLERRRLSEVRRDYDNVFAPIRDRIERALVEGGLFPVSPRLVRGAWGLGGGLIMAAAVGLAARAPEWLGPHAWTLPLGLGLSGLILMGFGRIMPRKTWRGRQALLRVLGFQDFLERAEKDRLQRMPGDTLHRWLPWATALGVSERWIFHFEGLEVDAPTWYTGRGPFTLADFASDVDMFSRRAREAIQTTRRGDGGGGGSSGFSGGSSGGGMGGGGGGTF